MSYLCNTWAGCDIDRDHHCEENVLLSICISRLSAYLLKLHGRLWLVGQRVTAGQAPINIEVMDGGAIDWEPSSNTYLLAAVYRKLNFVISY